MPIDDEYPDEEYEDDESVTVSCPDCGAEVYEDAERCPHCGSYITHSTSPLSGRPWGWLLLGLLGILAAVLALSGFLGVF